MGARRTDSRFDTLKVVMALLIVALHTKLFPSLVLPLARVAVPVFFIMSGYFFFRKIYGNGSTRSGRGAMGHFLKRSAGLYLFWFVAMLPFTIDIRHRLHLSCGPETMLWSALTGSTFVASWFIVACMIGMTIIYLLRRHLRVATVISAAAFLLCCARSSYFGAFPHFNAWWEGVFPHYSPVTSFPAGLLWICIGAWCARAKEPGEGSAMKWGTVMIAGLIMLYFEHWVVTTEHWQHLNDCYVSLAVVCPGIFMWVRSLPPMYYKSSLMLRHASVIAYCMHGSIAFAMLPVMGRNHISQPEQGIIVFLVTMAAVTAASWLILRLRRLKPMRKLEIAY